MALLCEHGLMINYDDNNNTKQQYIDCLNVNCDKGKQWCSLVNDLGTTNLEGSIDEKGWYNDRTSGIRVRPGYILKACEHGNLTGRCVEFNSNQNYLMSNYNFNDTITSLELKKDCASQAMLWDDSCQNPSDNSKYVNNNLNNRINLCNSPDTDLKTNSNCKKFCNNNKSNCSTSIQKYCNTIDINSVTNDPFCSHEISKNRCLTDVNLFPSETCKNICKNEPDKCRDVANRYCTPPNIMSEPCQEYCRNNPSNCKNNIKQFCTNSNLNNNEFCKFAIRKDQMINREIDYDNNIDTYCNSIGVGLDVCACFDKTTIKNNFNNIKSEEKYNLMISRPDCYYDKCINGNTYIKNYDKTCTPMTICSIEIGGNVNIKESNNIKIENNCGNNSNTTTTNNNAGTYTDLNIKSKQDCQMSDWSQCSEICKPGTQTRKIILEAQNNGKPCGPLIQSCLINCKSLSDQFKNNYYNFFDLDDNNKLILLVVIGLVIYLILK